METSENSFRYRGWRVLLASSACVFVSFASLLVYTFGVFLKPLAAEFHWSREAVSAAFGLAALSVAACSPFIGHLLDRFPARRIVLPCIAIFGCAFASLSLLTGHLWHLYAIFIVLGIVGNGTAQLAYSRAVSTWFEERRGMAFAILMCGGAVGAMLLPPLAQKLLDIAGWRGAFLLLGTLVLLIGLPAGSQVKERPVSDAAPTSSRAGASISEGLRSWVFWIIIVVLFCVSLGQNASIAHLAALLTDRGVPAASAALTISVLGGATLLGRILTGWLLDRYFAPWVAFCLLATSALGVFLLSDARSASVGFAGASLIGLGMGGEADVTPYLISKYFGLRSFATLYGFSWTAYAIAGAVGPVIMGRAFDATGSYAALLLWLSAITAGAGSLMLLLPRYARTRSLPQSELSVASSGD
jgi:predicted MFS family arabinose efflux permease